ncbi:MAG TPA: hypothetical protein VF650_05720 [Allosphingosinicella sp.]|jgi:hypothetical protein
MTGRTGPLLLALAALAACGPGGEEWPFAVSRSSGITIVTERPAAEERLRNATLDHGAFFVAKDCLQVRVGSGVFTPILPRGSSLEAGGSRIVVGGRRFETGRRYSLPFAAEVGPAPGEAAQSIGLPAACSQRLLSMGAPA